jgi:hypothetical protein
MDNNYVVMLKSNMNHPNQDWTDKEDKAMNHYHDYMAKQDDYDSYKYQGLSEYGGEDYDLEGRKQQNKDAYQEQPELSDLGQLTPYQEEMKGYISKYVNSELELNHEMSNYINLGYQGLSDTVKQGLSNDMDYQTLVQMSHDEDTFRRERGF